MKLTFVSLFIIFLFAISINAQSSNLAVDVELSKALVEKQSLSQKRDELRVKYSEDWWEIRAINDKLETLEKRIAKLEKEKTTPANQKEAKLLEEIFDLRLEIVNCKSCLSAKVSFVKKLKEALIMPNVLEVILADASQNELLLIIALQNQKLLESKSK